LTALGGIAALVIGGGMLLADASVVFVPVIGMVGGIAAMALANHEPTEAENRGAGKAAGAGRMARRGQSRRMNSGSGNRWLFAGTRNGAWCGDKVVGFP